MSVEEKKQECVEEQATPDLLFHYTTQASLHGILSSEKIWATHYRFLNDHSERRLGLDAYLKAIFEKAHGQFGSLQSAETLVDYLKRRYTDALGAYIVSFCTSFTKESYQEKQRPMEDQRGGDRLSQWRGYGRGSQAYCLAFDFQLVRQIQQLPQNRNCCYYSFCTYKDESRKMLIEAHIRDIEAQLDGLTANDFVSLDSLGNALKQDPTRYNKMMCFVRDMVFLCGILKHAGFQEENEYRIIKFMLQNQSNTEEVRFRFNEVPYVELPLNLFAGNSSLRAIFVGPSANRDQAACSLRIRLEQMGLSHVEVIPSDIPYRG